MSAASNSTEMAGIEVKDYTAMYSNLGSDYEDAFSHDAGLHEFLGTALPLLPPSSRVLDVGCGTGRPVASTLSSAGHHVLGVDISDKMVELSSRAVPAGTFEVGDMREYVPKGDKFDGVFNILSLFILSREEIEAMSAKWSSWLKPGGILCICTIAAEDVRPKPSPEYDEDGLCARDIGFRFLGNNVKTTLFTEDGWRLLLEKNGFEIVVEKKDLFKLPPETDSDDEMHYFLIARKN
jgi:SAM-dependent methyltransferase